MQTKVHTIQSTGNLIGRHSNFTLDNQSARLTFKVACECCIDFLDFLTLTAIWKKPATGCVYLSWACPEKATRSALKEVLFKELHLHQNSNFINNLKVPFKCRFLNKQTESNVNWSAIVKWLMGIKFPHQYYYYLSMTIAPQYAGILTKVWGKVVISTWQLRGNKVVLKIRFLAWCYFVPLLQALHHTKNEYSNGQRALCLELFIRSWELVLSIYLQLVLVGGKFNSCSWIKGNYTQHSTTGFCLRHGGCHRQQSLCNRLISIIKLLLCLPVEVRGGRRMKAVGMTLI